MISAKEAFLYLGNETRVRIDIQQDLNSEQMNVAKKYSDKFIIVVPNENFLLSYM